MTFRLKKKEPAVLRVDGIPCLTIDDLAGAMIVGTCGAPASPVVKPCVSIVTAVVPSLSVLFAMAKQVAGQNVMGMTDGSISGAPVIYSVQAPEQSVLQLR